MLVVIAGAAVSQHPVYNGVAAVGAVPRPMLKAWVFVTQRRDPWRQGPQSVRSDDVDRHRQLRQVTARGLGRPAKDSPSPADRRDFLRSTFRSIIHLRLQRHISLISLQHYTSITSVRSFPAIPDRSAFYKPSPCGTYVSAHPLGSTDAGLASSEGRLPLDTENPASPNDTPGDETDEDLLQLAERAIRNENALTVACGTDSPRHHVFIFAQAIESQHPDGSWGSDDYPSMKPCFTAQTIDMLWHLEKRQRLEDPPALPALMSIERIQRAVSWLRSSQRSDGSWGEDAWDTCQVLKALHLVGLKTIDPNVKSALDYLRSSIDLDWPDRTSYWFGPGFLGAAMEAFNRFGDQRYASIALHEVWKYFNEDVCYFSLASRLPLAHHAPPEWHTACVISGLRSFGSVAADRHKAIQATSWLANQQTTDGCWSPGHANITTYTTMQAIVALSSLAETQFTAHAKQGTEWFIRQCDKETANLSDRLMAAAAIGRTHADDIVLTLPLSFVTELRDVLGHYAMQTASLHTEVRIARAEVKSLERQLLTTIDARSAMEGRLRQTEEKLSQVELQYAGAHDEEGLLRSELASYSLKLTANQIAVLSVLITVISSLIGILVSLWLSHP